MINNGFEWVRQEATVAYLNSNYRKFPQKLVTSATPSEQPLSASTFKPDKKRNSKRRDIEVTTAFYPSRYIPPCQDP